MNRLREVIDQSLLESRQPEVEAELCVHSMIASASCTACVDACPLQAWILDDAELGLDTSRCDGCGVCVPACPEGAIQPLHTPLIYHWNERDIALVACERAGLDDTDGVIPCVHGIGLRYLLILYSQGVRDIMVACGDCSQCDRATVSRLDTVVAHTSRMLAQRSLPPIHHYQPTPERWIYNRNTAMSPAQGPEIGRRSFLRRAVGMVVKEQSLEERLTVDKLTWATPPGQMLPPGEHSSILPFIPAIDINNCNGCDVCVRLCPHQAITLDIGEAGDRASYKIRPDNCSGCNLCVDGCDADAININAWVTSIQHRIDLARARCRACGADYHQPKLVSMDASDLCRVCSKVNHYSNLHQVMD